MYYIINQRDHIIATDSSFLALFDVSTIEDLHRQITLKTIEISNLTAQELNLTVSGEKQNYLATQERLSTLLGDMTLVVLSKSQKSEVIEKIPTSIIDDEPITFDLSNNDITIKKEEALDFEEKEPEISLLKEDEQPFTLIEDEQPKINETEEKSIQSPTEEVHKSTHVDTSPIYIDIQNISQKIGISEKDYTHFLNEYIDTALTLEEDLKSSQDKKRSHAANTLSHLSYVLHLPVIGTIIEDIKQDIDKDDHTHIKDLYATLARLTTTTEVEQTTKSISEDSISETTPEINSASFGTIDLNNVKPIHFDFQLEEAADDLSLPVELIEEFVIDFIEQAHIETDKMLKAYEQGDLSTIQKIGHLLKGTSSNLRINPLSDTLYEIQFCEDSSKLEKFIKEYWGHFLSFEHQINMKLK